MADYVCRGVRRITSGAQLRPRARRGTGKRLRDQLPCFLLYPPQMALAEEAFRI
jgi:hypothetical protein